MTQPQAISLLRHHIMAVFLLCIETVLVMAWVGWHARVLAVQVVVHHSSAVQAVQDGEGESAELTENSATSSSLI